MTQGLPITATLSRTRTATSRAGGFEISTMVFVAASRPSASSASKVDRAPTRASRSRPPTPMPWDTPAPARANKHETSCKPVPEAETMPTLPRGTALANAMGTPAISAVPQSGPIKSRPRSWAKPLRLTSSSIETLSENMSTCSPRSSAARASPAAYSPGREIRTKFASGSKPCAPPRLRARRDDDAALCAFSLKKPCAAAIAASACAAVPARTAMIKSLAPASCPVATSKLAANNKALLDALAIMREASSTPCSAATRRETRMSATESRYLPRSTRFTVCVMSNFGFQLLPTRARPVRNKPVAHVIRPRRFARHPPNGERCRC